MALTTERLSGLSSRGTVLTTELNALGNGSYSAAGSVVDNSSNLDVFGIAELLVTFGSSPTLNAPVQLFSVIAPDGTDYEDGSSSLRPTDAAYLGFFQVYNTTNPQRILTRAFQLRPAKMKFILYNGSGVAFPASGSTVGLYTFNRTVG